MNCALGHIEDNLDRIEQITREISKKKQANVVCFPELATTGYSLGPKWIKLADEIPGKTTDRLASIASENGCYIICGIDEKDKKKIYDSAVLIDRSGKIVGTYRKVHLWDKEKEFFTPGKEFPVFQTEIGRVGIGICYDVEFPEPARNMAKRGAQIVFFPSAEMRPMENHVETYVKSRSAENCMYVAFSNRIGREGKTLFFGRSQIASPACRVLAKAGYNDKFVSARIDTSFLETEKALLPYLRDLAPQAYRVTA